jgi:hypothetical protein
MMRPLQRLVNGEVAETALCGTVTSHCCTLSVALRAEPAEAECVVANHRAHCRDTNSACWLQRSQS